MNTQLNPIVQTIGNKAAFTEAVNAAVSAYNNAANAIASLAVLSIQNYHVNSFNHEYISIVFNALQNNPKLLKGFKLMLNDMTLLNDECQPKKLKGNSRVKAKKAIESRKDSFFEQVNAEGFTLTKYVSCKAFEDKKNTGDQGSQKTSKATAPEADKKPDVNQQIKALQDEINGLNQQAIDKATELNRLQKEAGLPQSETTLQELARVNTAYAAMAKKCDAYEKTASDNAARVEQLKIKVTEADNKVTAANEKVALIEATLQSMLTLAEKAKSTKLAKAILSLAS